MIGTSPITSAQLVVQHEKLQIKDSRVPATTLYHTKLDIFTESRFRLLVGSPILRVVGVQEKVILGHFSDVPRTLPCSQFLATN